MNDTRISLIVARARNGVIGKDGDLPWRLPADLKYFKRITMAKPVVMGRKTFDSLGRPLPGRHNIVLTRDAAFSAEGCSTAGTLAAALDAAGSVDEVMIIGGAQIYALALPHVTRAYITEVDLAPDGDTLFETLDPSLWAETQREAYGAQADAPAYAFVTYDRVS
ncbi:MAG: dihydrofolate reductase [Pseudomonadota bacterium]